MPGEQILTKEEGGPGFLSRPSFGGCLLTPGNGIFYKERPCTKCLYKPVLQVYTPKFKERESS